MRLTVALVIGWLSFTLSTSLSPPTDPGHFFIPMGKTYPSYSSWAVTVSIGTSPYRKRLSEISTVTIQLTETADALTASIQSSVNVSDPNHATLAVSVRRLSRSVEQLQAEGKDLAFLFSDLLSLPEDPSDVEFRRNLTRSRHRPRRGLIDGIGKIMSSLFGTATEGEIKHLSENVRLVNSKEIAMAHMFNGTLTVLNSTRVATHQNRKALRKLGTAIQSMTESHYMLTQIARNMEETLSISLHVADLSESINQVTRAVHHLRSALSSLSDKLALARAGILHADLISSKTLSRVLRRINKALPTNFALPFPLSQIQDYIRIVKTKLIKTSGDYHVLFYVPLLHTLQAFNIYRFFPYHVPLLEHNVSLSYVPNEPRFLIVSENRQQYIQPADSEIASCILENHPFCQLHQPAYSMAGAASCVVSLFRQDRSSIQKFCAPVIRPTNNAPRAYYLADGKWLIVSRPPTQLTIVCPRNTRSHSVQHVVEMVTLELECSATGDSLYLPPYYASESHLDLPDFQPFQLGNLANDTGPVPIWRPRWASILSDSFNATALPPLHIDGVPADDYFNKIEALPLTQVTDDDPSIFSKNWLLIFIFIIIGLTCLGCALKCCCPRTRDLWTLPRLPRRSPPVPRNSPVPEQAIELLEVPAPQSPSAREGPAPQSPSQRRSPVARASPPRPAYAPCPAHDGAPSDNAPPRGDGPSTPEPRSPVFGRGPAPPLHSVPVV